MRAPNGKEPPPEAAPKAPAAADTGGSGSRQEERPPGLVNGSEHGGPSPRIPPNWGGPLSEADYAKFEKESWISRELADAAMLRRVDDEQGRLITGQKGKRNCAGILFPYYSFPWPVNYRIRRDQPDLTTDKNGNIKQKNKYLSAPGSGNRIYFPPMPEVPRRAPVLVLEGEKKSLAMARLATYKSEHPRYLPIALPGVWNWRGVIGKSTGPNGQRVDDTGPVPDLARIQWEGRKVYILFDGDAATNVLEDTNEQVLDTILHEVAHALVGPDVGPHGREWRRAAREIGAWPRPRGLPRLRCTRCARG